VIGVPVFQSTGSYQDKECCHETISYIIVIVGGRLA